MKPPTYSDFRYVGAFDVTNAVGVTEHVARFTVTRTLPDDNDPVAWVYVVVPGQPVDARPVTWGMWDSPTGSADIPVPAGASGTATLTTRPWNVGRNDPTVTFTA